MATSWWASKTRRESVRAGVATLVRSARVRSRPWRWRSNGKGLQPSSDGSRNDALLAVIPLGEGCTTTTTMPCPAYAQASLLWELDMTYYAARRVDLERARAEHARPLKASRVIDRRVLLTLVRAQATRARAATGHAIATSRTRGNAARGAWHKLCQSHPLRQREILVPSRAASPRRGYFLETEVVLMRGLCFFLGAPVLVTERFRLSIA